MTDKTKEALEWGQPYFDDLTEEFIIPTKCGRTALTLNGLHCTKGTVQKIHAALDQPGPEVMTPMQLANAIGNNSPFVVKIIHQIKDISSNGVIIKGEE